MIKSILNIAGQRTDGFFSFQGGGKGKQLYQAFEPWTQVSFPMITVALSAQSTDVCPLKTERASVKIADEKYIKNR